MDICGYSPNLSFAQGVSLYFESSTTITGAVDTKIRRASAGALSFSAPTAQTADGNLNNSEISFSVDEAGNNLKVKVKYSNGTVKNATVALV